MAKWWTTQMQCDIADECLQFFGGNGYMMEYDIAHRFIDSRIRRIAGGSSEVMREIISRKIFA
jgi:acyl-CoA dehydrogenase